MVTNTVVKEELKVSQPNASFHLDKLVRAGILDQSKDGMSKVYEINRDKLEERGINLGKLINAPVD
jgi:DNA-binding transcriptional ArsR family regulator